VAALAGDEPVPDNEASRSAGRLANTSPGGTDMRLIYFLLLVLFLAAVTVFVLQNKDDITIEYLNRSASLPLPAVVGGAYLLGMLTGWTVVGLIKRSFQRITERQHH